MPKPNVKDFEGSVPVTIDSKVTPVTRQPIEQLDATKWPEMSINELVDQRTIMINRINMAQAYGNNSGIVQQLEQGLRMLEFLLKKKDEEAPDETVLI